MAGQPSADGKEQSGARYQRHPNDYFPDYLEIAHSSAQLTRISILAILPAGKHNIHPLALILH
jgi:hypothetical protein